MFSNSPNRIQIISPEKRVQILDEIVCNLTSSADSPPFSFSDAVKFIQSERDHPFIDQPEVLLGKEQKLANGTRLKFSLKLPKNPSPSDLVINLDTVNVEGTEFKSQKGQFVFYLSRNSNGTTVNFVGIQNHNQQFSSTSQPVLDATLEKRLIQQLDTSLMLLLEEQRNLHYLKMSACILGSLQEAQKSNGKNELKQILHSLIKFDSKNPPKNKI